jgi:hypothetical protein
MTAIVKSARQNRCAIYEAGSVRTNGWENGIPINVGNKTVNMGITSNNFDLLPLRKTVQSPLLQMTNIAATNRIIFKRMLIGLKTLRAVKPYFVCEKGQSNSTPPMKKSPMSAWEAKAMK